jgi:hypothetical protein
MHPAATPESGQKGLKKISLRVKTSPIEPATVQVSAVKTKWAHNRGRWKVRRGDASARKAAEDDCTAWSDQNHGAMVNG